MIFSVTFVLRNAFVKYMYLRYILFATIVDADTCLMLPDTGQCRYTGLSSTLCLGTVNSICFTSNKRLTVIQFFNGIYTVH